MNAIVSKTEKGMINSLMESMIDALSDILAYYRFNKFASESCKHAIKSSEDYREAIRHIDEKEMIKFTNSIIDLFCKDHINLNDLVNLISNDSQINITETINSYSNYLEALPENERKVFFTSWMETMKGDFQKIYDDIGKAMATAEINGEYETLLISQSIVHRLIINLSDLQLILKKKGIKSDSVLPGLFNVMIAFVRVVALAQGKIQLDDLYRTYSRLKSDEPICVLLVDKQLDPFEI